MAQIEKKRKKGRPSKADLAARRASFEDAGVSPSTVDDEAEIRRRSLRRKSFRYNIIDYDEDYLDEGDVVSDEDNEEEDDENGGGGGDNNSSKRRRGKKVKLVVKLSNGSSNSRKSCSSGKRTSYSSVSRRGRVGDSEDEEDEEDDEEREVKKLRINGDRDEDEEGENEGEEEDDVVEGRDEKEAVKGKDDEYVAGAQNGISNSKYSNGNTNTPLPDKKQLELILDKLQKKDTYGVYSEPVDPEELPDYHDVIKHPMDFSTVRKKLANGAYSNFEQFETDVFLISFNAMQYNSPDTVYYRQASAIKELAERKFERVRMQMERLERESKSEVICEPKVEPKSEHKERSYTLVKKQTKKQFGRGMQEPVGSDFSAGATLAMMDAPNIYGADHDGPLEGISSLADNILEKAEDSQSGKGVLPKFGRRTFIVDENRRATYNISNQPEEKPESVFTTFDSDNKQLIPVGLSGELSYARSLARYAANLGPMAWKIASKRIEQVLPQGSKYGRGWIGEYEPLPTPVLVFDHIKNPFASRLHNAVDLKKEEIKDRVITRSHDVDSRKDEKPRECHAQANVHLFNQPSLDGKMTESKFSATITQQHSGIFQQKNRFPRDSVCPENMSAKRVEPNSPCVSDQKRDCFPPKQHSHGMEMGKNQVETESHRTSDQTNKNILEKQPIRVEIPGGSVPNEPLPKGKNFLQSPRIRQPDTNGGPPDMLSNLKTMNNFVGSNRVITMPPHLAGAPVSFPPRQDQGLSDPVLVMKMMTEKFQRQQNGQSQAQQQPKPSSVPSPQGDPGGNAAQAAASAWMSVGSGGFRPPPSQNSQTNRTQISSDSLYNASNTRMFYPQAMQSQGLSSTMHIQPEKLGLVPLPIKVGNDSQIPSRPMVFPQMAPNDLSRFQVQGQWRGLSPHTQQKQKPDTLPPDLNVAFQSSVESQQPDLALQL